MATTSHVNTGVRSILEHPKVYNLWQNLIGGNQHRAKHFKKFFQTQKGQKVLDIGCGTAILLKHLEDGIDYYGCDMQESYIEYAQDLYKDKGRFFCEKVGDVVREDWEDNFDIVNAHGLLHHLTDEQSEDLLAISARYLKKGGYLVTVDSVYHEGQSKMSKWMVSKDRGQNIRMPDEYLALARKHFGKVEGYLEPDSLYIPFGMYTMKMYKV